MAAAVLLLINLILVALLFFGKPDNHARHPENYIKQKLDLTSEQNDAFKKLIKDHRSEINRILDAKRQIQTELFVSLNAPENTERRDVLYKELGDLQISAEQVNVNHFMDIKSLCTENQLDQFQELTKELPNLFQPRRPKK